MDRYKIMRKELQDNNYLLTSDDGMNLLKKVAQGPESDLSTGFTQWSEMYNLTKRRVTMSILREWDKTFSFEVK